MKERVEGREKGSEEGRGEEGEESSPLYSTSLIGFYT
jgi:hypothetical protein